jgi:3D (Asp-Asp-Asp) domain-containing protein
MLTQTLLSPPANVAGDINALTAPNAQIWRQQAEALATELAEQRELNEQLRAEIERLKAQQWRDFTATAYTAFCAEGCTGITATGLDVRSRTHVNGKRVIAADPSVIPLGTTVDIQFADGRIERAVALDTGGAIKGRIIDYLVSDERTAVNFGRQRVKIRLVKE